MAEQVKTEAEQIREDQQTLGEQLLQRMSQNLDELEREHRRARRQWLKEHRLVGERGEEEP